MHALTDLVLQEQLEAPFFLCVLTVALHRKSLHIAHLVQWHNAIPLSPHSNSLPAQLTNTSSLFEGKIGSLLQAGKCKRPPPSGLRSYLAGEGCKHQHNTSYVNQSMRAGAPGSEGLVGCQWPPAERLGLACIAGGRSPFHVPAGATRTGRDPCHTGDEGLGHSRDTHTTQPIEIKVTQNERWVGASPSSIIYFLSKTAS